MKVTTIIFFLLLSITGFSQDFGNNPSLSLPAKTTPGISAPKISPKAPSVLDPVKKTDDSPLIASKGINMSQTNDFVNPNQQYVDKFNKKEGNVNLAEVRKDVFFGDFKTKGGTVRIQCRDFGYVDGDQVKVYVNGVIARAMIVLEGDFKGFELGLEKGINSIEFEALNTGLSYPNTAEFQIFDDKGQMITSNMWNLATGFKGSIIIVKE